VLGAKEEGKLRSKVEELGVRVMKSLDAKNFKDALAALRDMSLYSIVGDRAVSMIFDTTRRRFSSTISLMARQVQSLILKNSEAEKDFTNADALLEELEQILAEAHIARAAGLDTHLLDVEEF